MTTALTYMQLLQGCESEKLHLSGKIQPFGALIRIDKQSSKITHASANLEEFTGISAAAVLSGTIEVLGSGFESALASFGHIEGNHMQFPSLVETFKGKANLLFHTDETGIVIEIEAVKECSPQEATRLLQLGLPEFCSKSRALLDCCQHFVDTVHQITGFDRVMVYKFGYDWSGEVIAECAKEYGSYLGLRFPASDIPAIARNLYMLNPFRMIPDTKANSVDILSLDGSDIDLTHIDLRSVSPVHIEYLTNMGVAASFSVPIKSSGALWGLLACHHKSPKYLTALQRDTCSSLAKSFAFELLACRERSISEIYKKVQTVVEAVSKSIDILGGIQKNSSLLMELLGASSLAVITTDEALQAGTVLDEKFISDLDNFFMQEGKGTIFECDNLRSVLPNAKDVAQKAGGVLAIKATSLTLGTIRFYWFRPEEPMEVAWAGNPNKPVAEDPTAIALSPRRSFDKWVEVKMGHCRPWSIEDGTIALKLCSALVKPL